MFQEVALISMIIAVIITLSIVCFILAGLFAKYRYLHTKNKRKIIELRSQYIKGLDRLDEVEHVVFNNVTGICADILNQWEDTENE